MPTAMGGSICSSRTARHVSVDTTSARPPDKREPRFWNRLYRNLGGWTFEDATARSGLAGTRYDFGAAAADYDNDGDVDLHVTGLGGNTLYRNDGSGTFTDVTASAGAAVSGWSSSAAFLDYDHDGRLDLYVGRYLAWSWDANPVCTSADGTTRAYCHPRQFAPVPAVLLRNNGNGTFSDTSAASGIAAHPGKALGAAIHDYDRDGRIDLFVANDSMQQFLFRNTDRAAFQEIALQAGVAYDDDGRSFAGMGADVEDYDNDGWPDVIVTTLSLERYALFRATGRGGFEYASHASGIGRATLQGSGWGTKFVDFDNDGRRDLFVAQGHVLDTVTRARQGFDYLQPPLMLRNDPSTPLGAGASFADVSASLGPAFARPAAGRGAAFADLDDDGDIDIVIANLDAAPVLLRNEGGNARPLADGVTAGHAVEPAGHRRRRDHRGRAGSPAVRDLLDRIELSVRKRSSRALRARRREDRAARRSALAERRAAGAEGRGNRPHRRDRRAGRTVNESGQHPTSNSQLPSGSIEPFGSGTALRACRGNFHPFPRISRFGSCPPPLVGSVAGDELWRGLAVARVDTRARGGGRVGGWKLIKCPAPVRA